MRQPWADFHGFHFEREVVYETAFDNIVKVYSLKTDDAKLNDLLQDKYFHDFSFPTKRGVLLRQYVSKTSWPATKLVHLDLLKFKIKIVQKTKSSYNRWEAASKSSDLIEVHLSPEEIVIFKDEDS